MTLGGVVWAARGCRRVCFSYKKQTLKGGVCFQKEKQTRKGGGECGGVCLSYKNQTLGGGVDFVSPEKKQTFADHLCLGHEESGWFFLGEENKLT